MVASRIPAPNLVPNSTIDLDIKEEESIGLVLLQRLAEERGDRDAESGEVRGPDVDVLVALVKGRDAIRERDLLRFVGGVDVEAVVVDADAVVGVLGGDGDLELRGEDVGLAEVELDDGGVLEVEFGLRWAVDEVDDEDDKADDEKEEDDRADQAAARLFALVVAAIFALFSHGDDDSD